MDQKEFRRRYREAKRQCIQMTTPLILETLPTIHMCFISLAPEERTRDLTKQQEYHPFWKSFQKVGHTCAHEEASMVDWLSRDDFAPTSIVISIYGTTAIHTTFEFVVSGLF